jgi:hypothetical protein
LISSIFPIKMLYAFPIASMRATCPAHLILNDFTTLITLREEHKLWSCSLRNFLRPSVTPFNKKGNFHRAILIWPHNELWRMTVKIRNAGCRTEEEDAVGGKHATMTQIGYFIETAVNRHT